jgi:gluconate 2-dehydrogenase gamma chain
MIGFDAIDRRDMLARMALLLGAAALPEAALASAPRARQFLTGPRMQLLAAVADTMIPKTDTPGALDAKVPAKFDALLVNWAAPERRVELVGALSRIDAAALAQEKAGFVALTPEKRNKVLTDFDLAALKNVPDTRHLTGMAAMMAGPAVADVGYAKLRELVILLFFVSQEALTSVLTYEHDPMGWTPSIKVTPETRNTGGLGMF